MKSEVTQLRPHRHINFIYHTAAAVVIGKDILIISMWQTVFNKKQLKILLSYFTCSLVSADLVHSLNNLKLYVWLTFSFFSEQISKLKKSINARQTYVGHARFGVASLFLYTDFSKINRIIPFVIFQIFGAIGFYEILRSAVVVLQCSSVFCIINATLKLTVHKK